MLQISRRSEYGLQLLAMLAQANEGQLLSVTHIAQQLRLPYRYLSQIAGDLRKAKLISSYEGVKGGYQLRYQPQTISLRQVVETLDGRIGVVDCLNGKLCTLDHGCSLKNPLTDVTNAIGKLLESYSVADFMQAEKK